MARIKLMASRLQKYVDALVRVASEPDVMENIATGDVWSKEKVNKLIEYNDDNLPITQRKYFHWVILLDGKVIGYVGLYPLVDRKYSKSALQKRTFITASQQGKGYGKRASQMAIDAFTKMMQGRVAKIYSQIRPTNIPSIKLAESLGFKRLDGSFFVGQTPVLRYELVI